MYCADFDGSFMKSIIFSFRHVKIASLITLLFLFGAYDAHADISGLWTCDFGLNNSSTGYPQDFNLFDSNGTVTGQEFNTGTQTPFANITGTSSGSSFSITAQYISLNYFAIIDGTVSGSSMSGTWHNNSQNGLFTCTRSSDPIGDGGDDTNDPNKRNTALTMFCNRTGPTLGTANCTATIADTGAPTRILPTGVIDWEATDGFFPATAQCTITQVALSPGIGSCSVEFSVPSGFTIGARFPINASYAGDSNFNGSSTSHKLIIPACVSTDQSKPCPNSIGLSFNGSPAVIKAKVKALVACGSGASTSQARALGLRLPQIDIGGSCLITGLTSLNIQKLFESLSFDDAKAVGELITDKEANTDALLRLFKNVEQVETEERWKLIQETRSVLDELTKDVLKNQAGRDPATMWDKYVNASPSPAVIRKVKFNKSVKSESVTIEVKADKQKNITFKLPTRVQTLVKVYKRAGFSTLPLDVTVTAKQKKRKGKATVTESVDFVLE